MDVGGAWLHAGVSTTTEYPALTAQDRCDACGAQASHVSLVAGEGRIGVGKKEPCRIEMRQMSFYDSLDAADAARDVDKTHMQTWDGAIHDFV